MANVLVNKMRDEVEQALCSAQSNLERDTRDLLDNMNALGVNPPRFKIQFTVRLSGLRRYKTTMACLGYPELNETLNEIRAQHSDHRTYHGLMHEVHSPAVYYLELGRSAVKEPQSPFSSEFIDPRHMANGDFDLSMSFTVDEELTHSTNIEVNNKCSEALKKVLTEGSHQDIYSVWKPMKSVVYYVLFNTFNAVMKGRSL